MNRDHFRQLINDKIAANEREIEALSRVAELVENSFAAHDDLMDAIGHLSTGPEPAAPQDFAARVQGLGGVSGGGGVGPAPGPYYPNPDPRHAEAEEAARFNAHKHEAVMNSGMPIGRRLS